MTRDQVREDFKNKGLDFSKIGSKEIAQLRNFIGESLEVFENGSFKMELIDNRPFQYDDNGSIENGSFRVKGTHFDDREAITFNRGGFVGFSGWAGGKNVQPFLQAFQNWTNSLIQ